MYTRANPVTGTEQDPVHPDTSATGRVTRRGSMEGILVPLAAIVQPELASLQLSPGRLPAEHSVLCSFILVVHPLLTWPHVIPVLVVTSPPMLRSGQARPDRERPNYRWRQRLRISHQKVGIQ